MESHRNLFVLILLLSFSVAVWTKSTSRKVVYFPDPKNEGGLIPAFLEGAPEGGHRRPGNESDIHFYLITKNNPNTPDELFMNDVDGLTSSNYIPGAPLKVMAHGFGGSSTDGFPSNLARLYLNQGNDLNIILVDWSVLSESPWYNVAVPGAKMTGVKTAQFILYLIDQGVVTFDDIHVIGFSLGGQVAGIIGGQLGGQVARVTSLDPALPFYDAVDDVDRIDPTDGQFVDVVHTAGGYLWENGIAFMEPRGQVDFYPNSGTAQPGCQPEYFGSCSHGRAPDYFEESVNNPAILVGCKCENWEAFLAGNCDYSDTNVMGVDTPTTARGSYYFRTNSDSPYGLGEEGTSGAKR